MSRICPKRVTGIKTFQTRIKMKVKTNETQGVSDLSKKHQRNKNNGNAYENESKNNENQRVSDLSEKRDRNENIPKADEIKIVHFFGRRVASPLGWTVPEFSQEVITSAVCLPG